MFVKLFLSNDSDDRIFILLSNKQLFAINHVKNDSFLFENENFIQNKEYKYHTLI